MKKKLFVLLIVLIANYSCSKKDQAIVITPPPLIEYPIDLKFDITPECQIKIDSFDDNYYGEGKSSYFNFFARSNSNLPNDSSGSYITISQNYYDDAQIYTIPQFIISSNAQNGNSFFGIIPDSSDFNLFKLPYQNGYVAFSGTCQVAPAPASRKYHAIRNIRTQPLTFSGFFDISNNTGSFSLKGTVYLPKK